jgi:hypothetical protein
MKNQKYQTVQEVFVNNYEALKQWRDKMCVPHRLPDAAQYFIAQRLCGPELIRVDLAYEPSKLDYFERELEFRDGSYLILPDEICENDFLYKIGLDLLEIRDEMSVLQVKIGQLRHLFQACLMLAQSVDILHALDRIGSFQDDDVEDTAEQMEKMVHGELKECFLKGKCHVKDQGDLLCMVKKLKEFLLLSPARELKIAVSLWLAQEMIRLQGLMGRNTQFPHQKDLLL